MGVLTFGREDDKIKEQRREGKDCDFCCKYGIFGRNCRAAEVNGIFVYDGMRGAGRQCFSNQPRQTKRVKKGERVYVGERILFLEKIVREKENAYGGVGCFRGFE